jgi:hypothetical protein
VRAEHLEAVFYRMLLAAISGSMSNVRKPVQHSLLDDPPV